eukprot:COSAG02_NODE_69988_length_197_cov_106.295918_1_plen_25_part_10
MEKTARLDLTWLDFEGFIDYNVRYI